MTEKLLNQNSGRNKSNHFDLEQKILKYASGLKVPDSMSKEEALLKLKSGITSGKVSLKTERTKMRFVFLYTSSIAAGLLLLFGIWRIWLYNPVTEVIAAKGQHIDYRLPDGSLVKINSDSRISFQKKDFTSHRVLLLDGEAYFEITKGNSFIINTKLADVKILGTTFNIFSRDNDFRVSCITGKVQVSDKKGSLIINPGETASVADDRLINYSDKNIETSNSWISGEFYFENAPLKAVFDEIERQFNVKFEGENIENKLFTGSFTNYNLGDALQIVCIPMGLKYEIGKNNKILISNKNP
jgi:transmembrane sensor